MLLWALVESRDVGIELGKCSKKGGDGHRRRVRVGCRRRVRVREGMDHGSMVMGNDLYLYVGIYDSGKVRVRSWKRVIVGKWVRVGGRLKNSTGVGHSRIKGCGH